MFLRTLNSLLGGESSRPAALIQSPTHECTHLTFTCVLSFHFAFLFLSLSKLFLSFFYCTVLSHSCAHYPFLCVCCCCPLTVYGLTHTLTCTDTQKCSSLNWGPTCLCPAEIFTTITNHISHTHPCRFTRLLGNIRSHTYTDPQVAPPHTHMDSVDAAQTHTLR